MPKPPAPKKPAVKRPARAPRPGALYAIVGDDLLTGLDTWVGRLNHAIEGPAWSRQDLVKAVVKRALKERGEKGEAP